MLRVVDVTRPRFIHARPPQLSRTSNSQRARNCSRHALSRQMWRERHARPALVEQHSLHTHAQVKDTCARNSSTNAAAPVSQHGGLAACTSRRDASEFARSQLIIQAGSANRTHKSSWPPVLGGVRQRGHGLGSFLQGQLRLTTSGVGSACKTHQNRMNTSASKQSGPGKQASPTGRSAVRACDSTAAAVPGWPWQPPPRGSGAGGGQRAH